MPSCVCAVCGKGPPTGPDIFRINVKGVTGIWACKTHGIQAINNLAKAQGPETVLEEHRKYIAEASK